MTEDAELLIKLLCDNGYPLREEPERLPKFTVPECDEIARRTGVARTIILHDYSDRLL
jgi:hypothetical protein